MLALAHTQARRKVKPMPGSTVVVVDDDEDNAIVLEVGLQIVGFVVKTARSLREAVALLESGDVDALVTDYSLGDGTAIELLATLGAKRPRLAILVTGHGSPEHVAESRAAGFDAHLVKPIDLRQLERTLRDALDGGASGSTSSSGP
jgi:CheY-like chemotaxis protein